MMKSTSMNALTMIGTTMTKIKVSEVEGNTLNHLVSVALGTFGPSGYWNAFYDQYQPRPVRYSQGWEYGGPIIEREELATVPLAEGWEAQYESDEGIGLVFRGPTPLIAAMRCFVSSKLGEEVEVPYELL